MAEKDSRITPTERRASKRFAIEQDASYRVLDHRVLPPEHGTGRTLDISSRGMLLATEQCLRAGKRVEVSVNWPASLEGGCPLKFVALGRVVRSDERGVAVRVEQHEFRTRRMKEAPAVEPEKPSRSQVPYY